MTMMTMTLMRMRMVVMINLQLIASHEVIPYVGDLRVRQACLLREDVDLVFVTGCLCNTFFIDNCC